MESVENCANSPDFDCQCTLKKDSLNIKIESYPESSKFYFTKSGITYEVNSYNKILDSNNNPLTLDSNLNNINLYKKLGYLKVANTNDRACSIPESRFRLCLKTDYKTEDYDGRSVNKKNVTLKFAITIKDNDTPPPLTGVEAINKPNSRNSVMVTFDESKKDGKRVPDIESYVIYLSDIGADFNKNMEDIRKTTHYRTLDVASKGYEVIRELDLNTNPECEIVDEKYCKFIYSAKDSDGNEIKTELHEDKLYYLADKEKFLYILNGTDSYNDLKSGREKFIAVTAVDTDGNEIDNINTSEKIIPGQNLVSITPIDNLAPGFVKIQTTTILNIITISYSKPEFFINGEPMDNSVIVYQAYIDWDCTDLNNPDFCSVKIPFNSIAETGDLMMQLDKTQNTFDRVGIIPAIKNSNVEAKYNSAYTERS